MSGDICKRFVSIRISVYKQKIINRILLYIGWIWVGLYVYTKKNLQRKNKFSDGDKIKNKIKFDY